MDLLLKLLLWMHYKKNHINNILNKKQDVLLISSDKETFDSEWLVIISLTLTGHVKMSTKHIKINN